MADMAAAQMVVVRSPAYLQEDLQGACRYAQVLCQRSGTTAPQRVCQVFSTHLAS